MGMVNSANMSYYVCDKCKKEFNSTPGYLSYGFRKGNPFVSKLCPDCKNKMSPEEFKEFEGEGNPLSTSEELGILGE